MKKINITLFLIYTCFNSIAQPVFQKIYGVTGDNLFGNYFDQTSDSGFIITGVRQIFGGPGVDNVLLLKTNANGNLLWIKNYGGSGYESGQCVRQTADGGYIIAGNASGGFGAGGSDIYLIKTDNTGTLVWSKTFGGTLDDFANAVLQTADGGYLVAGLTRSYGAGNEDMYLIRTDASGNIVWSKVIGSAGHDWINSIEKVNNGGYVLTGRIFSGGTSNYDDVLLMRMDTSGSILWIKSYTTGSGNKEGFSCRHTTDNGFIVCGTAEDNATLNKDIYLIKTDSSGNLQWTKTMDAGSIDNGYSVKQTNDGGFVICGSSNATTDAFLIKTNASGNLQWSKKYGGNNNDAASEVIQLNDGTYILCGITQNFALGDGSVYLVKTDTNGVSGCNESNIIFTVTNPISQAMIPSHTDVTGVIVNTPATNTGSGGILTTLCNSSVGINEITTDNSFLISPNPSTGNFIISFEGMIMKGTVEILNTLGEKVFEQELTSNNTSTTLNLSFLQQGVYFLNVKANGESWTRKIVKM